MAQKSQDPRYVGIDNSDEIDDFQNESIKVSESIRKYQKLQDIGLGWRLEVLKSGDGGRSHEANSGTEDIGVKYSAQFWRKVFEF